MNKKLIVVALLSITSSIAFAQTASTIAGTSSQSATQSAAQGGSLLFAPVSDSTVRYAASSAFGPALTSSNDTCMGSSSMGASGMSFGVALGSTWTDKNCMMLKNARELWNQGKHPAAMALMCTDDDINYSISVTGGVMDRRKDGSIIRLGCPMPKTEWISKGRPLIDPSTGQAVEVGSVVQAAPITQVAQIQTSPITISSVDSLGIVTTRTPILLSADDIAAHARMIRANAKLANQASSAK